MTIRGSETLLLEERTQILFIAIWKRYLMGKGIQYLVLGRFFIAVLEIGLIWRFVWDKKMPWGQLEGFFICKFFYFFKEKYLIFFLFVSFGLIKPYYIKKSSIFDIFQKVYIILLSMKCKKLCWYKTYWEEFA